MRYITFLLLLTVFIFSACSKDNSDLVIDQKAPVYKINKLEILPSSMDQVDSVFTRLDTMVHINNTDHNEPDFTFAPYESLQDSLSITPDDPAMADIKIVRGIYLPDIIINHGVYYADSDSIILNSFAQDLTMPLNRRLTLTETIISPTPKTKYLLTGEYFQVKFTVSFKAELMNLVDSSYSTITGKIRGSRITTGFYAGQSEQPRSIILTAVPVE